MARDSSRRNDGYGLTPPDWKPRDDDHLSEAHRRAREVAYEATMAKTGMGVAAKSSSPPTAIQVLALAIGQDQILLPPAVIVSRTFNDEGDEIATAIRVGRLTFTIEEAVRLGVLTLEGKFSHYRAGVLLHSTPEPGAWVRPGWQAEIPGRPHL